VDPLGLNDCPGGDGCKKPVVAERDPAGRVEVDGEEPRAPDITRETPKKGRHEETYANKPVKAQDATSKWEEFLGEGPYTNNHPRTKLADPDRLVSTDGERSIRYGTHEMSGSPTKHHYHEEKWIFELKNNVMHVESTVVRVPLPKK